jgi:hypothetical protein
MLFNQGGNTSVRPIERQYNILYLKGKYFTKSALNGALHKLMFTFLITSTQLRLVYTVQCTLYTGINGTVIYK